MAYKKYKLYNGHYHVLNQPQKCTACGKMSNYPKIKVTDTVANNVCEAEVYCEHCEAYIVFWGYGFFNTNDI